MPAYARSPDLFALARARLAALHAADAVAQGRDLSDEPLRDYIPRVSPGYDPPDHLAPVLALLERVARGEEVRAVVSAPPRHAKTDTFLAAFAWLLGRDPKRMHGYATYEKDLAYEKSGRSRAVAQAAGIKFLGNRPGKLARWHTAAGGGLFATSVLGPFTGRGITGLLVIDDSLKNRIEAESKLHRDRQWDWLGSVAFPRLEPGASVIITMARWHADDLAGRAVKQGYEHVNLPAISDPLGLPAEEGKALWPTRRPLAYLEERRNKLGAFNWSSLYQGSPRPRGGKVFRGCAFYDEAPRGGYRIAIGVDLAYTESTKADWSVAVVLALHHGDYYVLDVLREQLEAPAFAELLKRLCARYPRVRPLWYGAGTEKPAGQYLRKLGVNLIIKPPRGDKFQRAQPVAAAWNTTAATGRILVPRDSDRCAWVEGFVDRVCDFTGSSKKGEVDDEVDALAPAFDVLAPFAEDAPTGELLVAQQVEDPLDRDNGLRDL